MTTINPRARLHRALTDDAGRRRAPPVAVAPVAGSARIARRRFNPMPNRPLRLSDDQLDAVMRAAERLAVGDRDAFLRDVAEALRDQELGDGTVYRVITQVQRHYYDPPIMTSPTRRG
jgi:hypothetical protein